NNNGREQTYQDDCEDVKDRYSGDEKAIEAQACTVAQPDYRYKRDRLNSGACIISQFSEGVTVESCCLQHSGYHPFEVEVLSGSKGPGQHVRLLFVVFLLFRHLSTHGKWLCVAFVLTWEYVTCMIK